MQKTSSARSLASPSQIEPTALGFDLVKGANLKALASIVLGYSKARIDRKVYPSFFLFHPRASIANQASSTGLAFLGRDPQRENVPQAPFPRFGFGRTKNRQVPQGACRFLLIHYSLFTLH